LFFLLYAPLGALVPLYTVWLEKLGFTPLETAWACTTQALAALLAPLIAGQVADRWVPANRCLIVCGFVGAGILWALAELTTPAAVFWTTLAFWITWVPVLTLGTAVCFTHLASAHKQYGPVRMWGTIGWLVQGWVLGYWFSNPTWAEPLLAWLRPDHPTSRASDALRLASLLAALLGLYAFTLPHTPPRHRSGSLLAPVAALRLLRERGFAVFCVCTFGICVSIPFSSQLIPLYLKHLGVQPAWLGPTLTLGQSTEVLALGLQALLLAWLGMRGTMLLGLVAWALLLSIFTWGQPFPLVAGSLLLNGVMVCGFLVAGQVFVNSRATGDIRASAQALITFINGLGMFLGNLLVGAVREWSDDSFAITFAVGAALAAALVVVFVFGFPRREPEPRAVPEDAPLVERRPGSRSRETRVVT
jgi:nucleoside transporter